MRRWFILIGGICSVLGIMLFALDDRSVGQLMALESTPTATTLLQDNATAAIPFTPTPSLALATATLVPSSTATLVPSSTATLVPTATPRQVTAIFRGTCYANSQTVDVYASASGVAPNSRDDAGNTVTYDPSHLLDCNPDTAWRMEYEVQPNPTLSFSFSRPVALTRLGFVPGYDKRDPLTNQWRWYQNRRISEVSVILNYQDGQSCIVNEPNIPDSPDALWIDLGGCRPDQNDVAWLVTSVDVRVDYSRPPSAQPMRNFVVISDMFFEGFTYE